MRDEHLDSYHQEAQSHAKLLPNNLDADDVQPLLFDLVGLDKVEAVKSILHHFNNLDSSIKKELGKLAASSGSAAMVQLICAADGNKLVSCLGFVTESIRGTNFETLKWFLSQIDDLGQKDNGHISYWRDILISLLESGSVEMFQECEKYLLVAFSINGREGDVPSKMARYLWSRTISATARCPGREKLLCSLWAGLKVGNSTSNFDSKMFLGDALGNVADKTCSRALAKVLLEYGATIDYRRGDRSMTPLHRAAQKTSPQAAELMKFFLYRGADPEFKGSLCKLKISEEKGAKGIAKWLGMSWDELIQKVKLDRENGICPPEYM